jgi:uncharacterized LabA/DUF88 family protein
MSTESVTAPARHRVHVFVDFWNYELSMKGVEENYRTDWKKIAGVLSREAANVVETSATFEYRGMNVYGSYDERSGKDAGFRRWATTVLDTFPGVNVSLVARQRKMTGPKCPTCYKVVEHCPDCGADMRGTEEKGVDTRIATDMISLAWIDSYDIGVLVSADRDFVPVAEFLQTRGIKILHGTFPPKGHHLTQKCWGSINIPNLREQFRR